MTKQNSRLKFIFNCMVYVHVSVTLKELAIGHFYVIVSAQSCDLISGIKLHTPNRKYRLRKTTWFSLRWMINSICSTHKNSSWMNRLQRLSAVCSIKNKCINHECRIVWLNKKKKTIYTYKISFLSNEIESTGIRECLLKNSAQKLCPISIRITRTHTRFPLTNTIESRHSCGF